MIEIFYSTSSAHFSSKLPEWCTSTGPYAKHNLTPGRRRIDILIGFTLDTTVRKCTMWPGMIENKNIHWGIQAFQISKGYNSKDSTQYDDTINGGSFDKRWTFWITWLSGRLDGSMCWRGRMSPRVALIEAARFFRTFLSEFTWERLLSRINFRR